MLSDASLCRSPQDFLNNLARRSAQVRVSNLLASDQTTINSLPQSLADEVAFDRSGLDHIKDRP
jgi:hypothetical protein